jgi:HSP20 family molecular chaperone IbpA
MQNPYEELFNRVVAADRPEVKKELNFTPAREARVDKEAYVCRLTLPGIEPKDVQVQAQGNLLTLPEGVNVERLTAEYVNGVLEITASVAAAALPRKIEVKIAAPMQIAA